MSKASITITIRPDGGTEVKVDGVKGRSCRDVTKALREALGETTSDVASAEFYEQAQAATHTYVGGERGYQ